MSTISSTTNLLLLLLSVLSIFTFCHASLEDSCKSVASKPRDVTYDFCVTSLQADPGSRAADSVGLGIISANLTLANATSTIYEIKALLKKTTNRQMKSCLKDCLELYSDTASDLKDLIKSGKYDDANIVLSAAVDAPLTCQDGFEELGVESPLVKNNKDASWLAIIALVLLS